MMSEVVAHRSYLLSASLKANKLFFFFCCGHFATSVTRPVHGDPGIASTANRITKVSQAAASSTPRRRNNLTSVVLGYLPRSAVPARKTSGRIF